jgi:hypothetical protein
MHSVAPMQGCEVVAVRQECSVTGGTRAERPLVRREDIQALSASKTKKARPGCEMDRTTHSCVFAHGSCECHACSGGVIMWIALRRVSGLDRRVDMQGGRGHAPASRSPVTTAQAAPTCVCSRCECACKFRRTTSPLPRGCPSAPRSVQVWAYQRATQGAVDGLSAARDAGVQLPPFIHERGQGRGGADRSCIVAVLSKAAWAAVGQAILMA